MDDLKGRDYMKAKEYMEAIVITKQKEELHALFYEQMYDDDVDPIDSVLLSNLIRMKLTGEL